MDALVVKQSFLAGLLCPTQGWFVHHTLSEPPGPGSQWRRFVGNDVGRRARAWLGEGRSLPRSPTEAALRATADAVREGSHTLLFEASFAWGGLIVRADAIRRLEEGWTLIEVKSGKSSDDGDIKDNYLDDIAYTVCIAMKAGLPVARAAIILVSRDYRIDGHAAMFVEVDVTQEVMVRAEVFGAVAQEIAGAVGAERRPEPALKFSCRKCDYFEEECVGKDVPDSIFRLPGLREKKFLELSVYERISRLPVTANLTENQQRIADVVRSGNPHIDPTALQATLGEVVWPAYYLDFEAATPCLPWFDGSPPYDTVPFQYSLHIRQDFAGVAEHREYLAAISGDWRRELTERLLADLGEMGSIVVYSPYEKTRLAALAILFPDLRPALERVIARLFDLERVFKNGYSHPGFAGKTSIKKVLPVMVPDLRYDALEVNNGDDAAGVFSLMRIGEYLPEAHDGYRKRLLEYCKLDTVAMVRLHEAVLHVLNEVSRLN